jgi:hypothetical protein
VGRINKDHYLAEVDGIYNCIREISAGKDITRCNPVAEIFIFESGTNCIRDGLVLTGNRL